MTSIPLTVFQTNVCNTLPPIENNKPRLQQVDWSYPGELSSASVASSDRPTSLLRLLAAADTSEMKAAPSKPPLGAEARRPLHVPKRTRGLSEGSGLMQLEIENARGLKRSGSDESDNSNASGNSFQRRWNEIKRFLDDGGTAVGGDVTTSAAAAAAAVSAAGSSKGASASIVVGTPPKKIKVEDAGAC